MAIKDSINQDLKQALLGGDHCRATVLRGLKAAILNEEVATGQRDNGLNDNSIEQLLAKELKKRNESIEVYRQAGRPELVTQEEFEADIIKGYLPKQLSEAEISSIIDEAIAGLGIEASLANLGKIIGETKGRVGNSADGALIAKLVKEKLK